MMFQNAKWIWTAKQSATNQRAYFFFDAQLDSVPNSALLHVGCETKYWLWVNGTLAVYDGGLFRESLPGCGWYDTVDVARYLRHGHNEITLHVWYYGNGGRNNSVCPMGGLILASDALGLYSSAQTLCYADTAYYAPQEQKTSYLYGGEHTAYDARQRRFSLCPDRTGAVAAVEVGCYGDAPWGELLSREVPLLYFSDRVACTYQKQGDVYTATLPHAMHFSPYFKVIATGGEVIDVRSDRYAVNGGPGDPGQYFGHRAEYVCAQGEQEFEMLDWIFGESIHFSIPEGVRVLELGYRESRYDCSVTAAFSCSDPAVNTLFQKCVRTLQVCMRENYMDCPDRERGQWIGDVSVQAPQIIYLLDKNGLLLLRKAIYDFIRLRKGDRLVGNVPGDNWCELPSQSLNAISEWGMIATYYEATGDKEVLSLAFAPAMRYLALWETDGDGVVLPRKGDWEWYDHLYNCDKPILSVCWYYSALRFAKTMARELGDHTYDAFIDARMQAIERVFDARYWQAAQGYYASGDFVDDRANAMAVLAGLCQKEKYPALRYLLTSVFNSSTYMENYVLIALCEMGYKQDALRRMMCRYHPLIQSPNSTLWEDFFHLGTRNHAWSGGPATVLLRYFAGVQNDLSVLPCDPSPLQDVHCEIKNNTAETIIIDR